MKSSYKNIPLLLFFLLTILSRKDVHSQCCPYLGPLEIIPANPSDQDSIYVITNAMTPSLGWSYGFTIIDSGSFIYVNGCYFGGVASQPLIFIDTINLGVKPAGNYQVVFNAYNSSSLTDCIPMSFNSTNTSFSIGFMGTEEIVVEQKRIVQILDVTGKPAFDKPNILLIYQYSDGTREKVFRLE